MIHDCVASSGAGRGQRPQDHTPFNISVFYPLSTNKDDNVSTSVHLSLFYGKVGSVRGAEFGGLVNQVKRNVKGFETAGLVNIVGSEVLGFQSAGLINFVGADFEGVQTAGVYNYVDGDLTFFQSSGVFNRVEGSVRGFQTAGIANVVQGDFRGFQTSTISIAGDFEGAQVSVLNIAKRVKGTQIGVVNYSQSMDGIPIGVINYAEEGSMHAVVWGSNVILSNAGIKFAVNDYFYSMLSVGYNNQSSNISKSAAVGYVMGFHIPVSQGLFIDWDLGSYVVDNDELFRVSIGTKNQHMLQGRVIAGYELTDRFAIFIGGGQSYAFDHDEKIEDAKSEALFLAGLQLF
jgi:hypothetical protein